MVEYSEVLQNSILEYSTAIAIMLHVLGILCRSLKEANLLAPNVGLDGLIVKHTFPIVFKCMENACIIVMHTGMIFCSKSLHRKRQTTVRSFKIKTTWSSATFSSTAGTDDALPTQVNAANYDF